MKRIQRCIDTQFCISLISRPLREDPKPIRNKQRNIPQNQGFAGCFCSQQTDYYRAVGMPISRNFSYMLQITLAPYSNTRSGASTRSRS